jgi:hypothetical protein
MANAQGCPRWDTPAQEPSSVVVEAAAQYMGLIRFGSRCFPASDTELSVPVHRLMEFNML